MTMHRTKLPLRICIDTSLSQPDNRAYLSEIMRPFWNTRTFEENLEIFGHFPHWLKLVPTLSEADIALLPMTWNYYREFKSTSNALAFAEAARDAGKPLAVFAAGDYLPRIGINDAILFAASLNRSDSRHRSFAYPSIFPDIISTELNGYFSIRTKKDIPVVGFCGQAKLPHLGKLSGLYARNIAFHVIDRIKSLSFNPPPIRPHILLRNNILRRLANSEHVSTNFVIRERYWGGRLASNALRTEYIHNILNSDYVVCVRGSGNFSKRLYESLCCGRIPIFVNTDCVLPFDFAVNWREFCVWTEEDDLENIGERVADFHKHLSPSGFIELQYACREFWSKWLTLPSFLEHFHLHF